MELNKKAAYLQGLVDGLGIDDTTKEGKIIKAMSALLAEMAEALEGMDEDLSRAYDQINDLSDELEDLEADLYEDEDDDEDEGDEDEDDEDDDDEDDDERLTAASLAKVYAQNVLENFADGVNLPGNLPLLQDVIGYITERADGNATYTIKRNDVEWIGDGMDAVSVWNKYLTGKTTSLYQVLYRTANAVSNVTGVAVSAALRDVKGVYDTLTGLAGADDPLGMDKDLNRIALALDGGDADKASRLFAGQVDAKVKSGTDPADAVTAARSTVTKLYSKAYQQADSEERAEMLDALMGLEYGGERVYDLDTVTGWGVTVGSADITAALDTADADAVQEMIDERVRQLERADEEAATQASRMMEAGTLTREEYDSVLDSARDAKELRTAIRSAITKEMKPRYQAADTAGRQEIAEMLCRLKVDGLTVYEADDFKKWE